MRKVLRVVCLALLAAWLAPVAQGATPPFRPLGTGYSQIYSDGVRFAYTLAAPFEWDSPLQVRVFDELRGTRYVLTLPAQCGFAVIGGGQLMQSCPVQAPYPEPQPPDQPVVTDLATGDLRRPDVSRVPPSQSSIGHVYFYDVGRRWLAGARSGDHSYQRFYMETDTSRLGGVPAVSAHQVIDLDRRSLVRDLCRPLARRRNPSNEIGQTGPLDDDPWLPYVYERPLGLTPGTGGWRVERCGSHRSVTICRPYCPGAQLGGGIVTWYQVDRAGRWTLYAYDAARRRRWQWGPFPADGRYRFISHAGRWVFLSVGPPPNGPPITDLFVARLPRGR